ENCPDLRNTRIIDIYNELRDYNVQVDVMDPWADADEAQREYGITLTSDHQAGNYDAVLIAVAHDQFVELGSAALRKLCKDTHVLYDLKHLFPASETDIRL